jgi:putative transposase
MKAKRFKSEQISLILQEYDNGQRVEDLVRKHGISKATFYTWRKRYQGMDIKSLKRLKELEQENKQLKHMYAELALDLKVAKEIIEKKL